MPVDTLDIDEALDSDRPDVRKLTPLNFFAVLDSTSTSRQIEESLKYRLAQATTAFTCCTSNLTSKPLTSSQHLELFLSHDFARQHSLIDLTSYSEIEACIQHYVHCKTSSPANTSACILVPKHKGPWSKYFAGWKLLTIVPFGTPCTLTDTQHLLFRK